jgi:hypothetical protein
VGGWGIFGEGSISTADILAIYNTTTARYLMEILLGQGDATVSGSAARNHVADAVGGIPWPQKKLTPEINDWVKQITLTWISVSSNETTCYYLQPKILSEDIGSIKDSINQAWLNKCNMWQNVSSYNSKIQSAVNDCYEFSDFDKTVIAEGEGPDLSVYSANNTLSESIEKIFQCSVEELTLLGKKHIGAKRFVVKKAFYVDRKIDLACHINKLPADIVIDEAKKIDPLDIDFGIHCAKELLAWGIGCCFGRWDIRKKKSNQNLFDQCKDPFSQLPDCSPGMILNSKGRLIQAVNLPADYPIEISPVGCLADDTGNINNIVARLHDVFEYIWKEESENIEQELCEILEVSSIGEYMKKPARFFEDHLKLYSKSRRQAPIYWPISTTSGSYTLWLYYHCLSDQTLYVCVNDFVGPKLEDEIIPKLSVLRAKTSRSKEEEKELEKITDLELELKDFRDELLRIAKFWKPNLNDGVQITAAPLWDFFRLPKWNKKLKTTWQKLEKGDYDWAHLAYSIWPERVIPKAHKDRSLAIAHDLENDLWEEVEKGTDRQGNPKYKWEPKELAKVDIDDLISLKTEK